jgi:hypothetical protein
MECHPKNEAYERDTGVGANENGVYNQAGISTRHSIVPIVVFFREPKAREDHPTFSYLF